MSVKINVGLKVAVYCPYHPRFRDDAKALGGKWDALNKAWLFDTRDEQSVRELCIEHYGTDGTNTDLVTLRCTVVDDDYIFSCKDAIRIAGREIAHARGRDSGAVLGDKIVFIDKTPRSGGSVKNWGVAIPEGSVFEIRDLPRNIAERVIENPPFSQLSKLEIIEKGPDLESLQQVAKQLESVIAAKQAQLDKVLQQIEEIAP